MPESQPSSEQTGRCASTGISVGILVFGLHVHAELGFCAAPQDFLASIVFVAPKP